jgi:predicted DsbA family dithiol-disulfide isomerase
MSTAPVRLQVWSDYACPFCYLELPLLDRLQREYGERPAAERPDIGEVPAIVTPRG